MLAVSLDETGGVDLDRIADLLGTDGDGARAELGQLVYDDPATGEVQPASQYLSGNVRHKLDVARQAAERDPRWHTNVAALERVLPRQLEPTEITAGLGAPWIPASDVEAFCREVLGAEVEVERLSALGHWTIALRAGRRASVSLSSEWGTARADAISLLDAGLNQRLYTVTDQTEDGRRIRNDAETIAARDKQDAIATRFGTWVWEDPQRAQRLAERYNEVFSSVVLPAHDGGHLSLPGLAETFRPHQHQRDAVARILTDGRALLAHAVGAGKTATMVMAAMEQRRLGSVTKPAVVVPNHMLEQFTREWLQLYPTAKVLVADKDRLSRERRKEFVARCATGDWDGIIFTQSGFSRLPLGGDLLAGYLIHGSADLGVDPDPRATFLWVTDDPALNRQTRNKMIAGSDLLQPARLVILDDGFMSDELSPGRVYFLNIQKLSKTAGLSKGGSNLRQHSFWDILANTIKGESTDLYVVLDEAHRGMKATQGRRTIVQRIIGGKAASNPPAPMVWGISATIERFRAAMEGATDRTDYPPVQVDVDKVRASGLVKDEIGLDESDEKGSFGSTLLREAVQATLDYEQRWTTYSAATGEPAVLPVLVLQVPDKASKNKLGELVEVIESEWPGLGPHAIAHVFGEHEPIGLDARTLRWVHPETIQDDTDVRIVMAKTAISTGWDCPRAEVLYSERPASDATHIAQVVGRMVRQPLAHRIATDDALNSVACFLPKFDRSKLGTIKAGLEGAGKANGEGALGAAVVRDPKVFERNSALDPQVFTLVESLKGLPAPDILASPLRRARVLAQLLTDDKSGSALMPDAGHQLTKALNKRLDGLAAEYDEQVEENVKDIETGQIHRSRLSAVGEELESTTREVKTHFADIDRDTRKIIKRIKEGAGQDYYAHRVEKEGEEADKSEIRIRVAALLMIEEVVEALDDAATKWVQERLERFAVEIKNTTGASRNDYLRVQEQTVDPEPVDLILRDNVKTATRDGDGNPLPTFPGHLYADESGEFPVTLNKWERTVVETEIDRPSFVAWYRNPSRATAAALRIAYQTDAGDWTSLQPDFLVVSKRDDGSLGVSIIDPHGDHLADAKNKLKALARFAERFGDQFVRIESVTEASDDTLRSLDLKEDSVQDAVGDFTGAEVGALYESESSMPFG